MSAARARSHTLSLVLLLFAAPARAQTAADDAAGWSSSAPAALEPPAEPMPAPAPPAAARAYSPDDVAGWGTPSDAARSIPPASDPDDAAGWSTPTSATAAPTAHADDAAGWSTTPSSTSEPSAPSRTYPRFDARFRDRRGFWLRDADFAPDQSRIAQMRSSLDLSVSYAPSFRVGDREGSFRAVLGWRGEYDLAHRLQRDDAQRALIDSQPWRLIGQESYLALRLGSFELKSGRLIMPLGTGEVVSTLDLLNPRDLRQPGLVDNETMRLAVLASRASITLGSHLLEALVVHESYFGLLPPVLGRFSPLRKLLLEDSGSDRTGDYTWRMKHHPDRFDPGGTQAIGHYGYTGSGLDLDVYAGSALDQLGVARRPLASAFERRELALELYHPRFTLVATSGALTAGSFLLRWELGAQLGRSQLLRRTDSPVLLTEVEKLHQINGLLGLTYFGIPSGILGLEVMQSGVLDNPARKQDDPRRLLLPVEATNIALRYAQQLWNDRVNLELVGLLIGVSPYNTSLVRADVGYNFRDGLSLHLIYAHYEPGSDFGLMYGFGKNDRLDASFLWAFGAP
jgi:hypothetical protein